MNTKIITTVSVLGVLVAFLAGVYFGRTPASDSPSPLEAQRQSQVIASLQESNQVLKADVERLNVEAMRLAAANAQLIAQVSARPPPPPEAAPKGATLGWMPRYEQQRTMMNNLRQIDAARKQVQLETGRPAGSIHDIVGIDRYIKTVRPVAGEDYSQLSMDPAKPLTLATPEGMAVTFNPSGATTTKIEMPPEVARAEELMARQAELARKVAPARQTAVEAYRLANQGKDPSPQNPQALIPFFANPQDGADFVELLEAQKAAAEAGKAAAPAQKAAPR